MMLGALAAIENSIAYPRPIAIMTPGASGLIANRMRSPYESRIRCFWHFISGPIYTHVARDFLASANYLKYLANEICRCPCATPIKLWTWGGVRLFRVLSQYGKYGISYGLGTSGGTI